RLRHPDVGAGVAELGRERSAGERVHPGHRGRQACDRQLRGGQRTALRCGRPRPRRGPRQAPHDMTVRVGTSGYNYDEWKGSFYPADLPASRMLAFYAERFDTVEINAKFYWMPSPMTLPAYAARTAAHSVFALMAPQRIAHFARLHNVDEPVRYFVAVAHTPSPKL